MLIYHLKSSSAKFTASAIFHFYNYQMKIPTQWSQSQTPPPLIQLHHRNGDMLSDRRKHIFITRPACNKLATILLDDMQHTSQSIFKTNKQKAADYSRSSERPTNSIITLISKPCNNGTTTSAWLRGFMTRTHQSVLKGWRMDDRLVSQAIYPSFRQLTCGGNIVKGVHEKKPISLTPWLALKTLWATHCETVKKQQMREEWEQDGEKELVYFFGRIIFLFIGFFFFFF